MQKFIWEYLKLSSRYKRYREKSCQNSIKWTSATNRKPQNYYITIGSTQFCT